MDNEVIYEAIEDTEKKKNICGTLSFIFSLSSILIYLINCGIGMFGSFLTIIPIIGTVIAFVNVILVPVLYGLSVLLVIAGLILGIIGVRKKDSKKGLAIAGLIISALIIIFTLITIIIMLVAVGGVAATALVTGGIYGLGSLLESM